MARARREGGGRHTRAHGLAVGRARHGMARHGMARHGMARHSVARQAWPTSATRGLKLTEEERSGVTCLTPKQSQNPRILDIR